MSITTNAWTRPATLAEIAQDCGSMSDFHDRVRDFLHEFQAHPGRERLVDEPALLREKFPEGAVADAYLAAVAVELSADLACARPRWTCHPLRTLDLPWFAARTDELRIVLLHESPAGFRERNLFVSENALSVA
jgi:hypothetical protein